MDYFTHISGSRPKYHPADVVEWEETVEAVVLFTPRPESAHEARMGEVIGQGVACISGQACSGRSPIGGGL